MPTWLWVFIIVVVLLLLIWWLMSRSQHNQAASAAATAAARGQAASEKAKEAGNKLKAEAEHFRAQHEQHKVQEAAAAVGLAGSAGGAASLPDLAAGRTAIGHSKKLDPSDLTVIEGIGPKISAILNQGGISTWHDLAATDPSKIQELLHQAGPQFNIHRPQTWPQQAALLQNGRWSEFNQLTEQLKGGVAEA